jgi:hypothetical protein
MIGSPTYFNRLRETLKLKTLSMLASYSWLCAICNKYFQKDKIVKPKHKFLKNQNKKTEFS